MEPLILLRLFLILQLLMGEYSDLDMLFFYFFTLIKSLRVENYISKHQTDHEAD